MKAVLKWVSSMILTLAVLLGGTITALSSGTVSYAGNAEKFIFLPGSTYSPTDLFSKFKNVMPGDSLTQQITVRNDASNEAKVKIYVRSLGAESGSADFLSQMYLTIEKSADDVTDQMFAAAADQRDGMDDWVLLGTLYSGGEVDLDVTLHVPVTMGNEYQDQIGYLEWQFMVEEFPIESTDPQAPTGSTGNTTTGNTITGSQSTDTSTNTTLPKTGDDSRVVLYGIMAAASILVLSLVFGYNRKKSKNIS